MAINDSLFYRDFKLDIRTLDKTNRSIDLSLSSEYPVRRWYGKEILLHGINNVDLSRLDSALFNHDPDKIIGQYSNQRIEKKQVRALLTFDDDELGNMAMNKVDSGSLRGASAGYSIEKFRELREGEEWEGEEGKKYKGPSLIALHWTPYEASLTPIGADHNVGIGRCATRSLAGIEIERKGKIFIPPDIGWQPFLAETRDKKNNDPLNQKEDKMDKEEMKAFKESILGEVGSTVRAVLTESQKPKEKEVAENERFEAVKKSILDEVGGIVRTILEESKKPKLAMDAEQQRDLCQRAATVSLDCKSKVMDMTFEGKGEPEIMRFIDDQRQGKKIDKLDQSNDDGTKRGTGENGDKTNSGVRTWEDVDEKGFLNNITSGKVSH